MIRVRSSEPPAAASDLAEHAPPARGPFRAALHAAGKADRGATRRSDDDAAIAAAQAAQQLAARSASREAAAQRDEAAGPAAIRGVHGKPPLDGMTTAADAADAGSATESFLGASPSAIALAPGAAQAAQLADPAERPAMALTASQRGTASQLGTEAELGTEGELATQPTVPRPDDSPVAALLAAAVGRAIGSLGKATGPATASTPPAADAAVAAMAPTAPPVVEPALAMTPLEQAVHDLLGRIAERDAGHERAPEDGDDASALAPFHLLASAHLAATARDPAGPAAPQPRGAAPIQVPEPPANPSHVHLVLEDGAERTVVTVALRGAEVHVALRSTDDATTAALARNAASLDHAMRARGLALGELTAEREPTDRHPPPRDAQPREPREAEAEPFTLEETP